MSIYEEKVHIDWLDINVRRALKYVEVVEIANMLSPFLNTVTDDGVMVETADPLPLEAYAFLKYCTDLDLTPYMKEDDSCDIFSVIDMIVEKYRAYEDNDDTKRVANNIVSDITWKCTNWTDVMRIAYNHANNMMDSYNKAHSIGGRLLNVFGGALDGADAAVTKEAKDLGERLISLIDQAKQTAQPVVPGKPPLSMAKKHI